MATTDTQNQTTPTKAGLLWKKVKRIFLFVLIFVIFVGGGVAYFAYNACYSDGERTGTVQKFSRRGMIFKTYEGELILRDFSMQQNSVWAFSVSDAVAAAKIEEAMRKGNKVVLHYCQKYKRLPWQGETDYFITSVNVVGQ
jgi:zona occludens toxin (predicted ATPase)